MAQLELYLPVKPLNVIQGFGANPAYYARFIDTNGNPYKGHMGVDLQAYHGQPVYAPVDGMAFYVADSHGGDGIYIQPHGTYDHHGGQIYMQVIHWHLCSKDDPLYKPKIPTDGGSYPVKRGDLIGYADNTGAPFESSGDHLHWGLRPIKANGVPFDPGNGFGGCVDPLPYCNMQFVLDSIAVVPDASSVITGATNIVTEIKNAPISTADKISVLESLKTAFTSLLNWLKGRNQ